jgi:hypothetical protein
MRCKNRFEGKIIPYFSISNMEIEEFSGCNVSSNLICVSGHSLKHNTGLVLGGRQGTSFGKHLVGGEDLESILKLMKHLKNEHMKKFPFVSMMGGPLQAMSLQQMQLLQAQQMSMGQNINANQQVLMNPQLMNPQFQAQNMQLLQAQQMVQGNPYANQQYLIPQPQINMGNQIQTAGNNYSNKEPPPYNNGS